MKKNVHINQMTWPATFSLVRLFARVVHMFPLLRWYVVPHIWLVDLHFALWSVRVQCVQPSLKYVYVPLLLNFYFIFYKNKTIFIHSNWQSTSFDIPKNVNGESTNKFVAPKFIAYDDKMPTNNMIKL